MFILFFHTHQNRPNKLKSTLNPLVIPPYTDGEDDEEEDLSGLHPGALLYRSAALQHFPVMADALAHGADVNWVTTVEESSPPLIQAVTAVSEREITVGRT